MAQVTRSAGGLLSVVDAPRVRVLFTAPYAPDGPGYGLSSFTGDGTYPHYHQQVFERLRRLGLSVQSSSKAYSVLQAAGLVDYVFCLYNRMHFRGCEVFLPAVCEYLGIPYLGASPNVRALAEDKLLSKMAARSLGIPVPEGVVFHNRVTPTATPPFEGPYFIKDRYGKGSEGITADNAQDDWAGAVRVIEKLWSAGTDALVEELAEGIDVTVPVVGDERPRVLGVFHPPSDKPRNILTQDLKLTDPLGYRWYDAGPMRAALEGDVQRLWASLGEIDYLRLDYRVNPKTGERRFLEMNICCYIGESGPFGMGAAALGVSADALLGHIVAFSLERQKKWQTAARRRL